MGNVVCGKCGVRAQVVTDSNGQREVTCPSCGQRDKIEDVVRIAGEHAAEDAKAVLNKSMSDLARGSKFIKFTPGSTSRRSFKWKIVD